MLFWIFGLWVVGDAEEFVDIVWNFDLWVGEKGEVVGGTDLVMVKGR